MEERRGESRVSGVLVDGKEGIVGSVGEGSAGCEMERGVRSTSCMRRGNGLLGEGRSSATSVLPACVLH